MSNSSYEAEYRTLAMTTCELQWLTFLLKDLGIPYIELTTLFCDNQSTIQIASNPIFHERTKHIEIDCHIFREKITAGLLKLLLVPSSLQIAHIFTKSLTPITFTQLKSKMGMKKFIPSLREHDKVLFGIWVCFFLHLIWPICLAHSSTASLFIYATM